MSINQNNRNTSQSLTMTTSARDESSSACIQNQSAVTLQKVKGEHMRLFIMAMLVIPSTALAGWSLYEIFLPNGLTPLEVTQLTLGLTLFAWLCMAFWTGIIGFFLQLFNIDPLSLRKKQIAPSALTPITKRHAVVMPVYNEDTRRIMGF